ncbi:MAG: biopolymer transporter ExbD [Bdellovibrionales bacterium]|jgi:biopolymer transport protein ExbD|nr:biopolymer transporter ExbD [Bdellovibrionales bacterium]
MAGGIKRHMEKRLPSTFKIQITSMVDMFVIILVFLLKSYSTSPVNITPNADLRLPTSNSLQEPVDVIKMVISKKGVFIEDKRVVEFDASGSLNSKDIDASDPSFIPGLFKELDEKAKQTQDISKQNETVEFDGRVLMQADRDMPYSLLQKVMYTSMLAGYPNVKLAVAAKDF